MQERLSGRPAHRNRPEEVASSSELRHDDGPTARAQARATFVWEDIERGSCSDAKLLLRGCPGFSPMPVSFVTWMASRLLAAYNRRLSSATRRLSGVPLIPTLLLSAAFTPVPLYSQDSRKVTEPHILPVYTILTARLSAPGGAFSEASEQLLARSTHQEVDRRRSRRL